MSAPALEIILIDLDLALAMAWKSACGNLPGVRVERGSIFDVECDAVVSPANSFGFMDGGIDAQYTARFGERVEQAVRRAIFERHGGELLVGEAEIVQTGDAAQPWLIAAPTMRVPSVLEQTTVNPYLAVRAVLRLIRHGVFTEGPLAGQSVAGTVRRVAIPGMGTGVGRLPAEICARQMRTAIEEHALGPFAFPTSWAEASERHQLLYTDKPVRLQ